MPKAYASVWRDDGVINYKIPAQLAANTFIVLAAQHSSWLCFLLEDMASVLRQDDVNSSVAADYSVNMSTLSEKLIKSHRAEPHSSRMERLTGDIVRGTMHPSELAALADDLEVLMAAFSVIRDESETATVFKQAWGLWIEGAKKFVRPSEAIPTMMIGTQDDANSRGK